MASRQRDSAKAHSEAVKQSVGSAATLPNAQTKKFTAGSKYLHGKIRQSLLHEAIRKQLLEAGTCEMLHRQQHK